MRNNVLATAALSFGLLGGSSLAQTTAFEDVATGITFQQISEGTYTFGIAMPATASSDFIGRISSQGNAGWAGISLGGPMRGSLMVVARPNEGAVIGSLRLATGYANPGVYSGAATLEIIAEGTAYDTESTNFTMTFLCKGCLQGDDSTFAAADATTNLGWATSSVDVTTPADASTVLGYHDTGFGLFAVDLAAAQSASFAEWAALASQSYSNSPATPTNPTAGGGANGYGNNTAPATPPTVSNTTYDYIVIGSGPSGLISSQRLTETGKSVLLIERGMATTFSSGGERFVPWNNSLTYYDVPGVWGFMNEGTQGEAYCTDTAAIAGCALGGGGAVNAMAFIRPANFDFDDKWPETWKSADLAPAAERLYSRNPGTTIPSNDGISYDNATQAVLEPFFEQNGWSNTDYVNDPDSKDQVYGLPSLNVANGLRSGPIHTYLPLAQAKPDFTLALHTKVIRILRNASTITGVEVENASGREIINLNPSGAVILAAGSMSTPRLLFNSGIGPTEQINIVKSSPTGVTVPESDWISLPVGVDWPLKHLWGYLLTIIRLFRVGIKDHSTYALIFNVTGGITARSREEVMNPSELDLSLYQTGSGVLAHSQQRLDVFRKINMTDGHTIGFQMHCMSVNVNDTITCQAFETHGLTSAGVLGIKPDQATYFTKEPWANNDVDRKAWEMFIDEVFEMARQPGSPLVYSGGAEMTAAEYLAASKVSNGYHVVGSTKMGSDDGRRNGTAVVDLDTKVYGTDNLFIVDASFHPDLPTGNTQAQVMVAAERAIERIIALRGETWSPTGGYSQGTPPPTGYTPATPPTGEKSNGSPEDTPPTGEKTNGYPQGTPPTGEETNGSTPGKSPTGEKTNGSTPSKSPTGEKTDGYPQGTPPTGEKTDGSTPSKSSNGEKTKGSTEDTPPTGEKTDGYPQGTPPTGEKTDGSTPSKSTGEKTDGSTEDTPPIGEKTDGYPQGTPPTGEKTDGSTPSKSTGEKTDGYPQGTPPTGEKTDGSTPSKSTGEKTKGSTEDTPPTGEKTDGYPQGTPPTGEKTDGSTPSKSTGEKTKGSTEDTPPTGEKTDGYPQGTPPTGEETDGSTPSKSSNGSEPTPEDDDACED
ncbi:uncharacterized protein L3040_002820 [Drepanopeziza brunnea f. sp. 'multigermtubi']|uniref:uncharacterized protein n=1 Tax=Drepanopeziza brunnea f. sp. 'multigermtubi' TaxID=698441 RepID=UPI0023951E24|nr:hypothetical protein L3040_002820 [Drepanopeziza brunnea f. sp. 'multigermtubi']